MAFSRNLTGVGLLMEGVGRVHSCGSTRRIRVSVDMLTSLRRALQNRLLLFLNSGRLTLGHLLLHMHFAQIIG